MSTLSIITICELMMQNICQSCVDEFMTVIFWAFVKLICSSLIDQLPAFAFFVHNFMLGMAAIWSGFFDKWLSKGIKKLIKIDQFP